MTKKASGVKGHGSMIPENAAAQVKCGMKQSNTTHNNALWEITGIRVYRSEAHVCPKLTAYFKMAMYYLQSLL